MVIRRQNFKNNSRNLKSTVFPIILKMKKVIDPEDNKVEDLRIFHTTWIYQVLNFLGFTLYNEETQTRLGFFCKLFRTPSIFIHLAFAYSVAIISRHEDVI